ncbi:MAG: alpha/beta hydrolase [Anaerolineae bacterium]
MFYSSASPRRMRGLLAFAPHNLRNESDCAQHESWDSVKSYPKSAAAVRLTEVRIPVLLIVGDLDRSYFQATTDFMLEILHFGQKAMMNGTAHVPNMEYPQLFNQHVSNFLGSMS